MRARLDLDESYMRLAESWANSRVYATRLQVGALAVRDGQIISDGYNGLPSGVPNDQVETIEGGIQLYVVTNPRVIHAEENLILKCATNGIALRGSTVYCTHSACTKCADRLIQTKIERFVFRNHYRDTEGLDLLRASNIQVDQLPPIT